MPQEIDNPNIFKIKEELMAYFQTNGRSDDELEKLSLSELTNLALKNIQAQDKIDISGYNYESNLSLEHAKQIENDLYNIKSSEIFWPEIFCEYLNAEEKKKSHGEVFTPKDIVDFMLLRIAKYSDFRNKRVCDLACGNGVILYEIAKKYKNYKSLHGVDMQPFSAWLSYANACLARPDLQDRVVVRSFDSILNRDLFSEPYDIIVSNPPYIGQKNNKELFEPLKKHVFWSNYYTSKSDYLYFFIIQSISMCSPGGIVCLITTQYWLTATKADKLRQYIADNTDILEIHDFGNIKLFKNASGQENLILILRKKNSFQRELEKNTLHISYNNSWVAENQDEWKSKKGIDKSIELAKENKSLGRYDGLFVLNKTKLTNDEILGSPWHFSKTQSDINKKENCISVDDFLVVQPGIQTGSDKVNKKNSFVKENQEYLKNKGVYLGDGIYVLTKEEIASLNLTAEEKKLIKPFFKVSDINEYGIANKEENYFIHAELIEKLEEFPNIKKHLSKFKEILSCRFKTYSLINNEKIGKWWKLVGARPDIPYEGEKILNPSRSKTPFFVYSNKQFYSSMDIFYTYYKDDRKQFIPLKFACAYLNCSASKDYLKRNCKKKGPKYELYKQPISSLPFPNPLNVDEKDIVFIAGVYSTKEKEGYEYNDDSGTWIKRAGLYDLVLNLHCKINRIIQKNSLRNLTNLQSYTSNEMDLDDYGFVRDCFSELSDGDYEYLDVCVNRKRIPSKKYQLNLVAIEYMLNKVLEKY